MTDPTSEDIVRVSGTSQPQAVGSIMARAIVSGQSPKMRAVGASATNQASKAAAIASGFTAPRGIHLTWIIGFDDIEGDSGTTISSLTWVPVRR